MYLIRCSLSLLMTGVHVPLHFLHSTFHKVWYISYLVPISHLPQLLKYFHCILTLFSEISFPFWLWQKPGCPPRTLPAQKSFYCFFSLVLSLLDLETDGCPPPSYSLSGHVLPFFLSWNSHCQLQTQLLLSPCNSIVLSSLHHWLIVTFWLVS